MVAGKETPGTIKGQTSPKSEAKGPSIPRFNRIQMARTMLTPRSPQHNRSCQKDSVYLCKSSVRTGVPSHPQRQITGVSQPEVVRVSRPLLVCTGNTQFKPVIQTEEVRITGNALQREAQTSDEKLHRWMWVKEKGSPHRVGGKIPHSDNSGTAHVG